MIEKVKMSKPKTWKAVWISTIDNDSDFEDYISDVWDDDGEREMSPFARDFGIPWYNPDSREFFSYENSKSFKELFDGSSNDVELFLPKLLNDLQQFSSLKYKSFMIIHNFKYEGNGSSKKTIFIGNYES